MSSGSRANKAFLRPKPGRARMEEQIAVAPGLEPGGQIVHKQLMSSWLGRSTVNAESLKTHIFARLNQKLVGKCYANVNATKMKALPISLPPFPSSFGW